MGKLITKYGSWGLSVLFGTGIFLFWWLLYPHALSYQEQYQLFLWTGDYFCERLSTPGGLADWIGEFIVQFYYIPWIGALLLALLYLALQRLSHLSLITYHLSLITYHLSLLLSFLLPLFMLWLMGDPSVLLSLPVAVVLALGAFRLCRQMPMWGDIVVIPLLYWLIGPVVWLYVILRVVRMGWKHLWTPVLTVAVQLVAYAWLLPQWPLPCVLLGQNYYRIPLHTPELKGYDQEMYELIWQDYKIRNAQWDDIVKRAQTKVVGTPFWSNSVNLALAKKRLLADRMFDFYQSGEDALIMPRVRDLTSMLPSAEAFWHLGMVNSAQRYMFDTQESILNGRKSGRCTKRIAECMLVNGHYKTAAKQIDLLKHSLFYKSWADSVELSDNWVEAHPVYGKLRKLRYKNDFLYNYEEMDKMLGLLFIDNPKNTMALDYFMGQMLLKGNLKGFYESMGMVQQYGGYRQMPLGYQEVMRFIQIQGRDNGSPYANYLRRQIRN